MNKIKLNANTIAKLPTGLHYDTQPGLCIRVSATCKSWNLYVWHDGKPVRRSLGKFPTMSVEAARKAARTMQGELDKGPKVAAHPPLGDLLDSYERHLYADGARHPDYARRLFNLSWKHLANRKLNDITVLELKETHDSIAITRGKAAAARAVKFLRCLYNFASKMEICDRNPARNVPVKKYKPRDVFLNASELTVLRDVLAEQPTYISDFFKMLLLTGARKGNVMSMRYEDIRGDTWTIPASQSKTGNAYEVPLHPLAQQIVLLRSNANGMSDCCTRSMFVFPSWSASGHVADVHPWLKIVRQACRDRGVTKHFTMHDLRRTFASMLTANGTPLTVVSKALGHTNVQTTPTYARADTETVRKAVMLLT